MPWFVDYVLMPIVFSLLLIVAVAGSGLADFVLKVTKRFLRWIYRLRHRKKIKVRCALREARSDLALAKSHLESAWLRYRWAKHDGASLMLEWRNWLKLIDEIEQQIKALEGM